MNSIAPIQLDNPAEIKKMMDQPTISPGRTIQVLGFSKESNEIKKELSRDFFLNRPAIEVYDELKFSAKKKETPLNIDLGNYLEMDSGTSEKYSIGTHTAMVLHTFENFVRYDFEPLNNMNLGEFRTFLSLHDSGKGVAVQELGKNATSGRKKRELALCQEIIFQVGKQLGWSANTLEISKALVAKDTIGSLAKKEMSPKEAAFELSQTTPKCLTKEQFLKLMLLFHRSDAGSYPFLRTFPKLFTVKDGHLDYHPSLKIQIKQLEKFL